MMASKKMIALALCGAILFIMAIGGAFLFNHDPSENPPAKKRQPSAALLAQLDLLPAPTKSDDKNLDETMKMMGRAFREIKTAKTTADMHAPLQIVKQYAEQAQIIGLSGVSENLQQDFIQEIKFLRLEISHLEAQIAAEDFSGAQQTIELLDQMRRSGHRQFKNL